MTDQAEYFPRLIARSWRHLSNARLAAAEHLIQEAESDTSTYGADDPTARSATTMLRASLCALSDDFPAAVDHLRKCHPEADLPPTHALLSRTLTKFVDWKIHGLNSPHTSAIELSRDEGKRVRMLRGLLKTIDAAMELQRLRLGASSVLASEALSFSEGACRHGQFNGLLAAVVLAQVHYEQGRLRQAEGLMAGRLILSQNELCPEAAVRAFPLLARICAHRHHFDVALGLLDKCEALAIRGGWPRVEAECLQERCSVLIRADDPGNANACLRRLERLGEGESRHSDAIRRAILLARVRVTRGLLPGCLVDGLRREKARAAARGDDYAVARISIGLVEACAARGDGESAVREMVEVLETGARTGLHQSFVDAGPAVGRLLAALTTDLSARLNRRHVLRPYVGNLLSTWRASRHLNPDSATGVAVEPLSGRERGVLTLIRRGYSNKEVAEALQITPETVKSHAKRLFEKLDARTRAQAVSRAEQLGLI